MYLHQHYAQIVMYHRLLFSMLLQPITILSLPFCLFLIAKLIDLLSSGFGLMSVSTCASSTFFFCILIRYYAPNACVHKQVLHRYSYHVIMYSLIISVVVFRYVVSKFMTKLWYYSSTMSRSGLLSMAVMVVRPMSWIRLSLGLTLLSAAVSLRFFGKFSIAQCSCFPLPHNPIDNIVVCFLSKILNGEYIIEFFLPEDFSSERCLPTPSKNLSQEPKKSTSTETIVTNMHRQYRRPTIKSCAYQILIQATAGGIFSHLSIFPLLPQKLSNRQFYIFLDLSCSLLSTITLCKMCLNNHSSHEIIWSYCNKFEISSMKEDIFFEHQRKSTSFSLLVKKLATVIYTDVRSFLLSSDLIFYWIFVSPISLFFVYLLNNIINYEQCSGGNIFFSIIISYGVTFVVITYILFSDSMTQRVLTMKGINVQNMLNRYPPALHNNENCCGYSYNDLLLECILSGLGNKAMNCIKHPRSTIIPTDVSNTPQYMASSLECEQTQIHNNMVDCIADCMCEGKEGRNYVPLEDDLMRLLLLESLGGIMPIIGKGKINMNESNTITLIEGVEVTLRHYQAIRQCVLSSDDSFTYNSYPPIVQTIHVLCAYAGGYGKALKFLSTQENTYDQWYISTAMSLSAQYAICAASRLFVANYMMSTRSGIKRARYHPLFMLVPSILHSAYCLRTGLLYYAKKIMNKYFYEEYGGSTTLCKVIDTGDISSPHMNKILGEFIATKCLDSKRLLKTCDEVVFIIWKVLVQLDGKKDIEFNVDDDCSIWIDNVLS